MPIPVTCGGCGKRFRAPDRGAGKKTPCPACKTVISIPDIALADDDEYRLAEEPPPTPAVKVPRPGTSPATILPKQAVSFGNSPAGSYQPAAGATRIDPAPATVARPAVQGWVPPSRNSTPTWLRHLHWCLALAMIPLAISIFLPDRRDDETVVRIAEAPSADGSLDSGGPTAGPASQPVSGDDDTASGDGSRLNEALEQMSAAIWSGAIALNIVIAVAQALMTG